jgi:hypothetical protein
MGDLAFSSSTVGGPSAVYVGKHTSLCAGWIEEDEYDEPPSVFD